MLEVERKPLGEERMGNRGGKDGGHPLFTRGVRKGEERPPSSRGPRCLSRDGTKRGVFRKKEAWKNGALYCLVRQSIRPLPVQFFTGKIFTPFLSV
jgi:hypothetical protein